MENMLKVDNLCYKNILKNITFTLKSGSFNVLMGPNGSGKTTLVNAILGLTDANGSIYYLDNLITKENIDSIRDKVCLFNKDSIFLEKNVIKNITYVLTNLNVKNELKVKKAYALSKELDIEGILYKDIEDITDTEKKVVLFASEVINNPKLIIVDDSFSEIDSYYRKKIIKYLKNSKSTILFISNNEEDTLLADNILFINKGTLIFEGTLKDAVEKEKILIKNSFKFPFIVDLSIKLKAYGLLDDIVLDLDDMVGKLWN